MIVWLTSYPRSGNSLLRMVLRSCFGIQSHSEYTPTPIPLEIDLPGYDFALFYGEQWESFYQKASQSKELVFIKTHSPPKDNNPVIYIVRDGRTSAVSYYHFHQKVNKNNSTSLLKIIYGDDAYGHWSSLFHEWNTPDRKVLLLKYEELTLGSPEILKQIAEFINYSGEIKPWHNPFDHFRKEDPGVYREGKSEWKEPPEWNKLLEVLFWGIHGPLMQKLGYVTQIPTITDCTLDGATIFNSLNPSIQEWLETKQTLQKVCDERLAAIQRLQHGCAIEGRQPTLHKPLTGRMRFYLQRLRAAFSKIKNRLRNVSLL